MNNDFVWFYHNVSQTIYTCGTVFPFKCQMHIMQGTALVRRERNGKEIKKIKIIMYISKHSFILILISYVEI